MLPVIVLGVSVALPPLLLAKCILYHVRVGELMAMKRKLDEFDQEHIKGKEHIICYVYLMVISKNKVLLRSCPETAIYGSF